MSVREENFRFTMANAIVELEKSGWKIMHIEDSWIMTKSRLPIVVKGKSYQYYVFHIHPGLSGKYGLLNSIKPHKSCEHDMPNSVEFLFKLMRED
jgi:hypothetical protein